MYECILQLTEKRLEKRNELKRTGRACKRKKKMRERESKERDKDTERERKRESARDRTLSIFPAPQR